MKNIRKSQTQGDFPQGEAPQAAPSVPATPGVSGPNPPMDLSTIGPLPDLGMPTPQLPAAPMAAPSVGDRQEILGPITSLTQIFYDMDIANFIENNLHYSVDDLTKLVWEEYGGSPDGKKDNSKIGKRTEEFSNNEPDKAKSERDKTENSKWERLEKGKSIEDIVSYSDLGKIISGLMYGVTMKISTQNAAQPGAGAPMMASANNFRIIIAKNLDKEYLFKQSDTIIKQIIKNFNF